MNRRTFLNHVFFSGPIAFAASAKPVYSAEPSPGILLLEGINPTTSAARLFSYLDPIISQNVPVGLLFEFGSSDWENIQSNQELLELLDALSNDYPGLIEVILSLPDLGEMNGYLRMRYASDARNHFAKALAQISNNSQSINIPQTLATRFSGGEPQVLNGIRSAGFLNAIMLPDDKYPPQIWRTSDGIQQIIGGKRLGDTSDPQQIVNSIASELALAGPAVVLANLPNEQQFSDDEVFDQGAVIGDAISRAFGSSRGFLTLPSDLRYRSGEVFARHVVLCVKTGDTSELQDKLTAADIAFTSVATPNEIDDAKLTLDSTGQQPPRPHICVAASGETDNSWENARARAFPDLTSRMDIENTYLATCAANYSANSNDAPAQRQGFDIILNLPESAIRDWGIDGQGALQLFPALSYDSPRSDITTEGLRAEIVRSAPANQDVVMLVTQDAFADPDDINSFVRSFADLQNSADISALDLKQYLEAVTIKDEPARLLKAALRTPGKAYPENTSTVELDALKQDAKLAWSYFEQMSDPGTGLAPATAWLEDGKVHSYKFATMWDTGTLVLAIISAHTIGLLSDDDFSKRISLVLANLATGKFGDLNLPKGLASTDGKSAGDDRYNASDTARLLVALHVLANYSSQDFRIANILENWDIGETIKDGVPQTVQGGRFVSAYRSNYAGYIARAFRLWGYPASLPFAATTGASLFDTNVKLLHEIAGFGPIGTEPHLLEAVELGMSDRANAASEALFAAQYEEYLTTQKLTCVSEGPINREPWFVYQGYQIGDIKDHWTAETLDSSARFKTKGFLRAIDMLNSKAAYLWHVVRPGDYHNLLIEQVRNNAMTNPLGFGPGVFSVSGSSDQEYSDINTNGVILQAIAYRMNAGKPGAEWRHVGPSE